MNEKIGNVLAHICDMWAMYLGMSMIIFGKLDIWDWPIHVILWPTILMVWFERYWNTAPIEKVQEMGEKYINNILEIMMENLERNDKDGVDV